MKKKLSAISGILAIIIIGVFLSSNAQTNEKPSDILVDTVDYDIYMPTKSSRPGCDETDSCYIPSTISIKKGASVTWMNQDVAFHSVTSGSYENPTGLFDSGHLDPDELFTFTFDESGSYDFFCTLHPWMKGKVIVEN